jgi:hypothetical protein
MCHKPSRERERERERERARTYNLVFVVVANGIVENIPYPEHLDEFHA